MLWNSSITKEEGSYRVLLKRGEFVDPARYNDDGSDRVVPYKLYYPSSDAGIKDCPVIIWSHGYGGSRDGAGFLARYLASYGYILVHLTHIGTDSSLWEGKPGHPWEILRDTHISRRTVLNRYRDIPFVVSELATLAQTHPELSGIMDLSRIGMSGHSFGAVTTQVALGQMVADESKNLISLRVPAFAAGIAYSPVPGMSHLSDVPTSETESVKSIYESIDLPLLHMTGTDDSSPINDIPFTERMVIYDESRGAAKAMLVKQGGDHMVYNGTRGQLGENPMRERHEEIIKVASLAWWEYWLKGDEAALNWLTGDGIQDFLGEDASWASQQL